MNAVDFVPYTLLAENERVTAYEFDLKPGETTDMHEHPNDSLLYPLDDGLVRYTGLDGRTEEHQVKAHTLEFRGPIWHSVENIGTSEVRALVVELR